MAGESTTATPAANGGIDVKGLGESLAAALAPALATTFEASLGKSLGPLGDQLKLLQAAQTPTPTPTATKTGDGKALTAEDVAGIVASQLKTFQAQSQQSAQRDAFMGEKMKDLPPVYRNLLGTDPNQWPAEEQSIRAQFKTDATANGWKPADLNVGGDNPGGSKPGDTVDLSKLSPVQQIALGLKEAGAKAGDTTAAAK